MVNSLIKSKDVYSRRTLTRSGLIEFLGSGFAQRLGQIVSISVTTLSNTNLVASIHIKREKSSLPVTCEQQTYFRSSLPFLRRIGFSRRVKLGTWAEKTGCSRRLHIRFTCVNQKRMFKLLLVLFETAGHWIWPRSSRDNLVVDKTKRRSYFEGRSFVIQKVLRRMAGRKRQVWVRKPSKVVVLTCIEKA